MNSIKITQEGAKIYPATQKTISFGANHGLHTISQMMNAWLEENPNARITQMIHENNCVLCLYETIEVVLE